MSDPKIFRGEDILVATCSDNLTLQAKAALFRQSGDWEEVVQGMRDLSVKFDPEHMSPERAQRKFDDLWAMQVSERAPSADLLKLEADFGDDVAPDKSAISARLGIATHGLGNWLASRRFRVTMMGFQPGFAYLEDVEPGGLPEIERLATPRQRVAAGSIGFLGNRACIYSLDGPGGWPIIGRVREPLLRCDEEIPFLLEPGQMIGFVPK